jgi:hypothetical protein
MQTLSQCAVRSSEQIVFGYDATNHRPDDPTRWTVYTWQSCRPGFMNPHFLDVQ